MKEGSESEIVASQKDVVSRLTSLGQGKEESQMKPVTDSTIVFEGGDGIRQVAEVVKGFGSVVSRDISAEKSSVEGQPSGSVSINQAVSFKVIVVDEKGNRMPSLFERAAQVEKDNKHKTAAALFNLALTMQNVVWKSISGLSVENFHEFKYRINATMELVAPITILVCLGRHS